MSNTIRRKNYEKQTGRTRGSKTAGYYTEYDFAVGFHWLIVYREPTKEEFFKAYYHVHRDNHSYTWSPGRGYRKARMVQNRMINKHEVDLWKKFPEYDIVPEANPRSCAWDWS